MSKQTDKITNAEGFLKQCDTLRNNQEQIKILEAELKMWVRELS